MIQQRLAIPPPPEYLFSPCPVEEAPPPLRVPAFAMTEKQFQFALFWELQDEFGFEVMHEYRVPTGRADLVAIKDDFALLIETKVQNPLPGINQLLRYHPYIGGTPVLAVPEWLASARLRYACYAADVKCWEIPLVREAAS